MLCWLLLKNLVVGGAGGRSEKTAPFWTKALYARERSVTKITRREPKWRVTMGPNFLRRLRRMASISEVDLRSHSKFPIMGRVGGPGGRCLRGKRRLIQALRRKAMEIQRRMVKQVCILQIQITSNR